MSTWFESEIYWICDVLSWFICSILITFLIIFHSTNVYQDLYTKNRKSTSHRPTKPDINKTYIYIIICTLICLLSNASFLYIGFIGNIYFMSNYCSFVAISGAIFWQFGKSSFYIILLLRLHTVYSNSEYAYKTIKLKIIGIVQIIFALILSVSVILTGSSTGFNTYNFSDIAIVCNVSIPFLIIIVSATNDILMCISLLITFIYPLKKLIDSIPISANNKSISRHVAKLTFVGLKYYITTSVAIGSTFLFLLIVGITDSVLIGSIDTIINCISIMLMTPYYDDKYYYKRICVSCILCFKCCNYNGINNKLEILSLRTAELSKSTELKQKSIQSGTITSISTNNSNINIEMGVIEKVNSISSNSASE